LAVTPGNPGGPPGYVLNWEHAADRTLPAKAPAGWATEYDTAQLHRATPEGPLEPQARAAAAPGEPVRSGTHSVRFQLYRHDKTYACGVRSELSADVEPPRADPLKPTERWYGFSIFLPYTWCTDPEFEILTQWHHNADTGSPPLAIMTGKVKGDTVNHWFISQPKWGTAETVNTDIGRCSLNEWTDWIMHVKWSVDKFDGLLEIWKNDAKVPGFNPKTGRNTYSNATRHYLKIGIYKWIWNKSASGRLPASSAPCGNMPIDTAATSRRVMYHDELRIVDGNGSKAIVTPPGNRPPAVP
jgi:hypothetical protein